MKVNTNLRAYLDDFGLINVYVAKSFYNGKCDYFYLSDEENYYKDCVIKTINEQYDSVRYQLTIPTEYDFSKSYSLYCNFGICCDVEVRYIVRKPLFDEMFYYDGKLGSYYSRDKTEFNLWAPTATRVEVAISNNNQTIIKEMVRKEKGVYNTTVYDDLKYATYVYYVHVNGVINKTIDPYGLSSTANSEASAVIDLEEAFKENDDFVLSEIKHNVDSIIYEINIRDMTSDKLCGSSILSKFDSLCEARTNYKGYLTGIDYIKSLNVTHVQIMPVNDFASVDELHSDRSYNWGYDPLQYFALEGSYSKDPNNPYDRIKAFKHLVCEFHKRNIRVNLDVVFNHIYDVNASSFHKCVPYYYFRYDEFGNISNGSYCGNDFDSTKLMFRRLMVDCIKMWTGYYNIDGFRFDLMGITDVDTMNLIYDEARKINSSIMIYGEGWNLPTFLDDNKKAKIENNYLMPNIGHFNDYFRDSLKGKSGDFDVYDKGYLTGRLNMFYEMASSLTGNSSDDYFKRFVDPNMSINYVEAHDNYTSWDKMKESCKEDIREIRKERQKLLIGCTILGQGVPFIHAGQEFCRTKFSISNSYNKNDNYNKMDWNRMIQNYDVVNFTKKMIYLRRRYKEFRLTSADEINQRVKFNVINDNIIEYMIDSIKVIINPNENDKRLDVGNYKIVFDGKDIVNIYSDILYVPSYSIVVCEKQEDE